MFFRWVTEAQREQGQGPGHLLSEVGQCKAVAIHCSPLMAIHCSHQARAGAKGREERAGKAPPLWGFLSLGLPLRCHCPSLCAFPCPLLQRTGPHVRPESQQILDGLFGNCFCF